MAYIDWSQQEFGIAAALSGDENMMAAYKSGDPYTAFAKQAGAIPPSGNKKTHGLIRERFKQCALAVLYGGGAGLIAGRIGKSELEAKELLRLHKATFGKFWKWSEAAVNYANLHGRLYTTFGWQINLGPTVKATSLGNFPMQANGAEMLRLACGFATESGIRICAPVHDALLIEAPVGEIDATVERTKRMMRQASSIILDGFELESDVKIVRSPERYMDERGAMMWEKIWHVMGGLTP